MIISVPKESFKGEKRVALTPESAQHIQKLGHELRIEAGAGKAAEFSDVDYKEAGVSVVKGDAIWSDTDIILKVRGVSDAEADKLTAGTTVMSFFWPAQNEDLLSKLAKAKINVVAMDSVPRLSRSQKMDALSSMANIGGYRAVVEASNVFGRFFTGQVTAAGKVPPAKVLIIGAGVAGLAAIGAAKSMGAIVRAFDTRLEAKEQVESLGAEFLVLDFEEDGSGEGGYAKTMSKEFIDAEMAMFREQAKEVDIIITTALIPGKPAPELITKDMVESMKSGSVIVDLAAEQGGNCKLSKADKVVTHKGVKIIGYTDLPSRLATQSSQLYATNLRHMLTDMTPEKDRQLNWDMEDDVIRCSTVAYDGAVTWPSEPPQIIGGTSSRAQSRASGSTGRTRTKHGAKSQDDLWSNGGWLTRTLRRWQCRAAGVYESLYRICARLLCGLSGYLGGNPGLAYPAHERHQCHLRHYCGGRHIANFLAVRLCGVSRLHCHLDCYD